MLGGCDRIANRVGDSTFRCAKIGERSWPIGFATAVLIKPIFENRNLESSQKRPGVAEGTSRFSVVAHYLSFLTEIFGAGTTRHIRIVFINVETRRVYISPSTYNPDEPWMIQQATAFVESTKTLGPKCKILLIDNDNKYSKPFLNALKNRRIKTLRTPIRSPNRVAFAERFVQTIKQECLDHFVVFGSTHRDVLCQEFNVHYHEERPHQGLGNELVIRDRRNARNPKRNHQKRIRFRFLRFVAKNGAADYSRGTVAKRRNSRRRSPFRVGFISDLSALLRVTRTSVRNDAC
jgi:hypothetical protein